jgi:hypothetical protein
MPGLGEQRSDDGCYAITRNPCKRNLESAEEDILLRKRQVKQDSQAIESSFSQESVRPLPSDSGTPATGADQPHSLAAQVPMNPCSGIPLIQNWQRLGHLDMTLTQHHLLLVTRSILKPDSSIRFLLRNTERKNKQILEHFSSSAGECGRRRSRNPSPASCATQHRIIEILISDHLLLLTRTACGNSEQR